MDSVATFALQPHSHQFNFPFSGNKWAITTARSAAPRPLSFVTSCPEPLNDPSAGDHEANEAVEFHHEAESSPEKQITTYADVAEKSETKPTAMDLRPRRHDLATHSAVPRESTREEVACDTRNRRVETRNKEKNKNPFSIALTKTEIDDDMFAMTGSTRPRQMEKKKKKKKKEKRPRTTKKYLDVKGCI